MISSITIQDLMNCHGINLIDLRNEQSFNNNHIPGAINIPYEKLIVNPSKYLDKNNKYFLYCQRGITSVKVCKMLAIQGYKVVNIIGGYEEWILRK
jgi:rhodanese-related sulfurtransferase